METETQLTPQEQAALEDNEKATEQAQGQVVDAGSPGSDYANFGADENADDDDDKEETFVERDGQVSMFATDAQIKSKTVEITEAYKSVQARLKKIAEHASFFKSFSSYMGQLDPGPEGDIVQENLKAALAHAADLMRDLEHALTQLKKVDELEQKLKELSDSFTLGQTKRPAPTIKMLSEDEANAMSRAKEAGDEGEDSDEDDDDSAEKFTDAVDEAERRESAVNDSE